MKLLGFFIAVVFIILPVSFWTDRNIDFWLGFIKGQEVNCPFILSFLATFLTNVFGFAFNIISEIARLII